MSDFVNFGLAQKLKEKGFREECLYHYPCSGGDYAYANCCPGDDVNTDYLYQCNNKDSDRLIDAPTISQVLNWIREEKKIHICIDIYDDGWFFDIASYYKEDTGVYEIKLPYKSSKVTPDYDSFEQAALAGIEYSLDNLI